ncbi:hypothetical protein PF005_g33730, partial [Phytophthora fragariae]
EMYGAMDFQSDECLCLIGAAFTSMLMY